MALCPAPSCPSGSSPSSPRSSSACSPGPAYLTWLPIVLAGVALLTFVIQLTLQRKEETVTRMVYSIGGALVILLVATARSGAAASDEPVRRLARLAA